MPRRTSEEFRVTVPIILMSGGGFSHPRLSGLGAD